MQPFYILPEGFNIISSDIEIFFICDDPMKIYCYQKVFAIRFRLRLRPYLVTHIALSENDLGQESHTISFARCNKLNGSIACQLRAKFLTSLAKHVSRKHRVAI